MTDISQNSGFKLTTLTHSSYHRGFHITFENGYTVSIQFGPNSVCSVKNTTEEDVITPSNIDIQVKDAEVAVISPDKELVPCLLKN